MSRKLNTSIKKGADLNQTILITSHKIDSPISFMIFLSGGAHEANSRLVLTDSGGVQEEACVMGVPCVTFWHNTERAETLEAGGNVLAETEPSVIVKMAKLMFNNVNNWENPFGDGKEG